MSPLEAELFRFIESFQQYQLSKFGGVFIPFPPQAKAVVPQSYGLRSGTPNNAQGPARPQRPFGSS